MVAGNNMQHSYTVHTQGHTINVKSETVFDNWTNVLCMYLHLIATLLITSHISFICCNFPFYSNVNIDLTTLFP